MEAESGLPSRGVASRGCDRKHLELGAALGNDLENVSDTFSELWRAVVPEGQAGVSIKPETDGEPLEKGTWVHSDPEFLKGVSTYREADLVQ